MKWVGLALFCVLQFLKQRDKHYFFWYFSSLVSFCKNEIIQNIFFYHSKSRSLCYSSTKKLEGA